jgi:hypothetical protein
VYLGSGPVAQLAIDQIEAHQQKRWAERESLRAENERLTPLEKLMARLDNDCALLLAGVMTAAGYHRHDHGKWRRKRVRSA